MHPVNIQEIAFGATTLGGIWGATLIEGRKLWVSTGFGGPVGRGSLYLGVTGPTK